ncbi:hypothetical protein SteCoe_37833 [Stentor coeruleus]|uniref:Uncharacterized protein n=1 Tax=Stentor coeruleus TaxID=5963 RepID=A0A1R2AMC5_9CILI|nr:hypothetical protein SteCoe_37833 [Stentor coeruleus]
MDFTDYEEELITSAGQNIEICDNIYLIDLLRLEYSQDMSASFLKKYLNDISRNQDFKTIENYQNLQKKSIVLLENFNVLIYSHKIIYITCNFQTSDISRVNLKSFLELNYSSGEIEVYEIPAEKDFSYIFAYLCENAINGNTEEQPMMKSLNFEYVKAMVKEKIYEYIYSNSKLKNNDLLIKIHEAKELIQTSNLVLSFDCEKKSLGTSVTEFSAFATNCKPNCDLLINSNFRSSIESLEYTASDDIGKTETSFRLSNTVNGRLPRLSGGSLVMAETPSKEIKKSFGDYTEFMESPKFSSRNTSPYRKIVITPVTSPKQSTYSIQEVKSILLPGIKKDMKGSPIEKTFMRKNKSNGIRTFNYQDFESKYVATEMHSSYEVNRSKTIFEGKKSSCQCQSCEIF